MEFKSEARTENLNVRCAPSVKAAAKKNAQDQCLTLADYIEMLVIEDTPDQDYRMWSEVQRKNAEKVLRSAAAPLGIDIDDADFNIENAYRLAELYKSKVLAIHCEKPRGVYTADRETGSFIDEFETVGDALSAIRQYEEADKAEGIYERGFYDVVDGNHVSYIR